MLSSGNAAPEEERTVYSDRLASFRSKLDRGCGFDTIHAMLARVLSAAVNGIEAFPVEVEVNSGFGETLIVNVGRTSNGDTKL